MKWNIKKGVDLSKRVDDKNSITRTLYTFQYIWDLAGKMAKKMPVRMSRQGWIDRAILEQAKRDEKKYDA